MHMAFQQAWRIPPLRVSLHALSGTFLFCISYMASQYFYIVSIPKMFQWNDENFNTTIKLRILQLKFGLDIWRDCAFVIKA